MSFLNGLSIILFFVAPVSFLIQQGQRRGGNFNALRIIPLVMLAAMAELLRIMFFNGAANAVRMLSSPSAAVNPIMAYAIDVALLLATVLIDVVLIVVLLSDARLRRSFLLECAALSGTNAGEPVPFDALVGGSGGLGGFLPPCVSPVLPAALALSSLLLTYSSAIIQAIKFEVTTDPYLVLAGLLFNARLWIIKLICRSAVTLAAVRGGQPDIYQLPQSTSHSSGGGPRAHVKQIFSPIACLIVLAAAMLPLAPLSGPQPSPALALYLAALLGAHLSSRYLYYQRRHSEGNQHASKRLD